MRILLFLILVIGPLTELWVLLRVGSVIGAPATLLAVIGTAALGTVLVRAQGLAAIAKAQREIDAGRPPVAEMLTGIALLIAGVMLFFPGFLTDGFGFLLLVPAIRQHLGQRLAKWVLKHTNIRTYPPGSHPGSTPGGADGGPGGVIDGDYKDVTPDNGSDKDR